MRARVPFLSCIALALLAAAAAAESENSKRTEAAKTLNVELNAVRQLDGACRLSLLIANQLGAPIRDLTFELVLFDTRQRVLSLVATEAGAMPVGKTRLKQFDIGNTSCDQIGRVLLNDVTRCDGDELTPAQCTAVARTSSRAKIPFVF
ncbi:MAG: hypothetical protein AAF732_04845 [Pseudomonadota bacterium]